MPKIMIIKWDWIFLSLIGNRICNNPITYNFHFILYKMSLPHMCGIHSLKVNWPFLHYDGWQKQIFVFHHIYRLSSGNRWYDFDWRWWTWDLSVLLTLNFTGGEESTMTFCLHRKQLESLSGYFYFLIWCQLFYASTMTFACYTLSFSELLCW